jgi:hypothetical protein
MSMVIASGRRWWALHVAIRLLALTDLGSLAACGGQAGDKLDTLSECKRFEDLYARCVGHGSVPEITPGQTIPTDPAARDHLVALCSVNANRLQQSCR